MANKHVPATRIVNACYTTDTLTPMYYMPYIGPNACICYLRLRLNVCICQTSRVLRILLANDEYQT